MSQEQKMTAEQAYQAIAELGRAHGLILHGAGGALTILHPDTAKEKGVWNRMQRMTLLPCSEGDQDQSASGELAVAPTPLSRGQRAVEGVRRVLASVIAFNDDVNEREVVPVLDGGDEYNKLIALVETVADEVLLQIDVGVTPLHAAVMDLQGAIAQFEQLGSSVEPILAVSTAHVSEADDLSLNRFGWAGTHLHVAMSRPEGWLFSLAAPDVDYTEGLSPGLAGAVRHAQAIGAVWLLLDRDAAPLDGVPTYEWN